MVSKALGAFITASSILMPSIALADKPLNAPSAAGTRVNSDPESLLRYGLPVTTKELQDITSSIESVKANLRTRRLPFAQIDLKKAEERINKNGEKILTSMPASHKAAAQASLARLKQKISPVAEAITAELNAGQGSLQQQSYLDLANTEENNLSAELSTFAELLVPDDYKRDIPEEYKGLPVLQGRAEIEMVIKKPDNSKYDVDGKLYDQVKINMVIDGYNAPLTGGNIVDLVNKGYYNNKKVDRSDGFVIQVGDNTQCGEECPEGTVHGYVPSGSTAERKIPLEISLKGDKELLYGISSEDEQRGSEAAVLPFQAYGALGMAREEYDANSASTQFFWLLFESDLTPAGKNLLDGRYSCFGYTITGADLLKGVKEGDVIKSAKVVAGADRLVL